MTNAEVNQRANLNDMEEGDYSWLNLHVPIAKVERFKNFLVLSNDSDVVTYLSKNTERMQVKYGLK